MTGGAFALAILALVWSPGEDWRETPDPDASPRAVKGGTLRFSAARPPKSYNAYIDTSSYTRMTFSLMYDTLVSNDRHTLEFVPSLARRWAVSEDGGEFLFEIDERAKWSDGAPVTAKDVKWTFDAILDPKSDTGPYKAMLAVFESPEILGERLVRFRKKGSSPRDWRDLMNCGGFWILPAHAFAGKDLAKIDFTNAPVSGPYALSRVEENILAEFSRRGDWWRAGTPAAEGLYNFDRIVLKYFIEESNAFEALKKNKVDVLPVYMARTMRDGVKGDLFGLNRILVRRVRNHKPIGFQGFAMNMRRPPFDDRRVREAMAKLVDREMMNSVMMSGEYHLQNSFYSDLYSAECKCRNDMILYDFEGAKKLLAEAGWAKNPATGLLEKNGVPFAFTFLSRSQTEDKFLAVFNESLEKLGIKMKIDRKDFSVWMRDMDSFNFDMTWQSWSAGIVKWPETMWISSEADRKGSNNTVGFKSAAVDALIAAEKSMATMDERNEAMRKIDKLISDERPFAFLWNIDVTRLVYWNRFGMPGSILSRIGDEEDVLAYWWFDEDRARELAAAKRSGEPLPSVPLVVDYDEVKGEAK